MISRSEQPVWQPEAFIEAATVVKKRLVPDGAELSTSSSAAAPKPTARRWARVVIEKPFGHDRVSSDALQRQLEPLFREQVRSLALCPYPLRHTIRSRQHDINHSSLTIAGFTGALPHRPLPGQRARRQHHRAAPCEPGVLAALVRRQCRSSDGQTAPGSLPESLGAACPAEVLAIA